MISWPIQFNPAASSPQGLKHALRHVISYFMTHMHAQRLLLDWYRQNRRELPWRMNRDPYRIWISETMLQQTTTTAVIPYFERFVAQFPNLKSLADAQEKEVLEAWAGLGYYSRARNLHKAARMLFARSEFPRRFQELLNFPGFGPYTARSVASLAFDQSVGVVDGNVIRVLSRLEAKDWDWWQTKTRVQIQERADHWVDSVASHEMNQALMELGRTVCMPKNPICLLCPLRSHCVSQQNNEVSLRPRQKPRRKREIWLWEPSITIRKDRILLCKNVQVPFLRGQWLLPGHARRLKTKPKSFDYRHTITHHDIYVTLKPRTFQVSKDDLWVRLKEIRQYVPASLVQKALASNAADRTDHTLGLQTRARKTSAPGRK
jgi:A/G-specific adenine glycosylase